MAACTHSAAVVPFPLRPSRGRLRRMAAIALWRLSKPTPSRAARTWLHTYAPGKRPVRARERGHVTRRRDAPNKERDRPRSKRRFPEANRAAKSNRFKTRGFTGIPPTAALNGAMHAAAASSRAQPPKQSADAVRHAASEIEQLSELKPQLPVALSQIARGELFVFLPVH